MTDKLATLDRQELVEPKDALALNRAPDLVLEEARRAAKAITEVIEAKKTKIVFNDKTYLQYEDWQTLGRFYGVTALVKSSKYVEFGEGDEMVRGFEASADALLVSTNQVISSAEAMCLNDEPNWGVRKTKNGPQVVPLFQLKSMAQTRACAKALRNVLAWVAVLAGYAPTPAEEMTGDEGPTNYGIKPPERKSGNGNGQIINAVVISPAEGTRPERDTTAFPALTGCPTCGSSNIQPAGVSRYGKPYAAFCRECANKRKK